jgi:hypothetical protein
LRRCRRRFFQRIIANLSSPTYRRGCFSAESLLLLLRALPFPRFYSCLMCLARRLRRSCSSPPICNTFFRPLMFRQVV